MKLTLTAYHFEELVKRGYSLDVIFMLKLVQEQFDISTFCQENVKIGALHQSLVRKGLISENDVITTVGQELLDFMETKEFKKLPKKKNTNTEFEDWWKTFPGTDTFVHKNKSFSGSRSLRINRDECKLKFDKILLEGEHTATDMIEALKYDVFHKKENSVKTGNNKLSYMQNSLTYLNQRSYEPFIELMREGAKIVETSAPVGGTDI